MRTLIYILLGLAILFFLLAIEAAKEEGKIPTTVGGIRGTITQTEE